jgi:hypothetical protein
MEYFCETYFVRPAGSERHPELFFYRIYCFLKELLTISIFQHREYAYMHCIWLIFSRSHTDTMYICIEGLYEIYRQISLGNCCCKYRKLLSISIDCINYFVNKILHPIGGLKLCFLGEHRTLSNTKTWSNSRRCK